MSTICKDCVPNVIQRKNKDNSDCVSKVPRFDSIFIADVEITKIKDKTFTIILSNFSRYLLVSFQHYLPSFIMIHNRFRINLLIPICFPF